MNTMIEGAAGMESLALDAPFVKIVGGGGTGKSYALAQRVAYLRQNGVPAADIALFASTESAADALQDKLQSVGVTDVQAQTLANYLVDMLSCPAAREATGRNPRLLADFEQRILMEDMKVCGLKPRRLKEMLKFFYREITELGDEKDDFILDVEESDIYETLMENLRLRGAMLPQELSNRAYKFLRDHATDAEPYRRAYVLADDFQNYNCASQKVIQALATKALVIAGSENSQVNTTEAYPYPKGFKTFELEHDDVRVIRLKEGKRCPQRITALANSLVSEGGLQKSELIETGTDGPCDVHFVKWVHPNDEFLGIARYIKHRLEDNTRIIHGSDIFVAVPNAIWGNALAKVLRANHIKVDQVTSHNALKGDPRKTDRSLDLQAYTRLNLAADPTDAAAWRNWCGFGDYVTNSNVWFRLEKYAKDSGIGALEALERAELLTEGELFAGSDELVERYRAGLKFIELVKGMQGFALLNHCSPIRGEEPPRGFMDLVEPVTGAESASELLKRANSRLEARFQKENDAVRIGLMEMSCGMEFDTVIFMGCVEGFYPALDTIGAEYDDDRIADIRRQERREWYAAMTKARRTFVASTVQKDESNTAAALGMYAHRIRMEDGKSMAILAPTSYLDEMGVEAPGFEATL